MPSARRIGTQSSETRALLIRAAEELMREEGYAQVTSRKLAVKAGLKPQLVHYYFRTMSELFSELFRQATKHQLELLEEVAHSEEPLVRLFELSCDPSTASLQLEFLALANHRKELHALIAEYGRELNRREAEIVRSTMSPQALIAARATPEELAAIIETAARGLAFSGKFGSQQFDAARATVIAWLRRLSGKD